MKKIARRAAYGAIGIVLAILVALLIVPEFLDSSGIEAELQRNLSQAVGGEVKWEKLQIRLLPTPRGVLKRLQLTLPGTSAGAEQVDATLALMPLFRGHAEVVSLKLSRPEIRVELSPGVPDEEGGAAKEDAGETYRRIMGEVGRALREFAPDTVVEIRNGNVELRSPDKQPFVLRELSAQARSGPEGLKLQIDTASDYWQRARLTASVAQADLSASASLEVSGLRLPGVAIPASLRAKARTDARTSLELTLEEARRGGTNLGPGELRYTFKEGAAAANIAFDIDAAQAVESARAASMPLGGIASGRGRASGKVTAESRGEAWKAEVRIAKSDAGVQGWNLPAPVVLSAGALVIDAKRLALEGVELSMADSRVSLAGSVAGYDGPAPRTEARASFDLDVAQGLAAARAFTAALDGVESASGRISANATLASRGEDWQAKLDILKSDASLRGWRLPAALGLFGGSIAIDPRRIDLKDVALSAGEGKATVSATYDMAKASIDGRIESPVIIVDALIPKKEQQKAAEEKKSMWPLPVTGRVALRAGSIRYERHNFAPVSALLTMESDNARLEIKEAQVCGISLPLTLEAREAGLAASMVITAQRQQIADSARCLSEERVQITGEFDLRAVLSTKGTTRELVKNLEGTLVAGAHGGELAKFALIGNIQKTIGLKAGEGFPYRSIVAKGRFRDGRFWVDEASLESAIMGLAGTGWISLGDYESRLTILVAPLAKLDEVVRAVPLVGYVIGGAVTSIPVGVSGDIRDPLVVPLGPGAITSELTGIIRRTIKLPGEVLREERNREKP